MQFDFDRLTAKDYALAESITKLYNPDLVIAPDGKPYLYRWHIVKEDAASVYFHIQVSDDPERPLHTHPWDNTSVILSGGYKEILYPFAGPPIPDMTGIHYRNAGDVIHRRAFWAHRLLLPGNISYTMTLFSTGPKGRVPWGFWYPEGFRPFTEVTSVKDGVSIHVPFAGRAGNEADQRAGEPAELEAHTENFS